MLHLALFLLAVPALVCFAAAPALAADETTHDGTFIKAVDGKLTMEGAKDAKEHTCMVAKDAKITCDGKECKIDDLKKGVKLTVTTTGTGEKMTASKIEASTK